MVRVYAARCSRYEQVQQQLTELLRLYENDQPLCRSGERIVLKPNLLLAARPDRAATTHPALLEWTAKRVREAGAEAVIADSPGAGYPHNRGALRRTYEKCGLTAAADRSGARLNWDLSYRTVSIPDARLIRRFEIITPVLEADAVYNLAKLKTHGFMAMTAAVKNCFGIIPGLMKPGYHAKLQRRDHFAAMLLDLSHWLSPRLSILDAVVAMEGDGPNAGEPRQVGWLLASTSPLALDVVSGDMIGLRPQHNPVLTEAKKRGWPPYGIEQVELVGADIRDLRQPGFRLPAAHAGDSGFGRLAFFQSMARDVLSVRPEVNGSECVACGVCAEACPVDAIVMESAQARIDKKSCIRCYCCHELCPERAISLQRSWTYRLIQRLAFSG